MNKTPESHIIASDLFVAGLMRSVTDALEIQDTPNYAHVAVYYSHALMCLMHAGKKGSAKADIEKARSWLEIWESSFGLSDHRAHIQNKFTSTIEKSAHSLASCYRMPWLYELVTARLSLLDIGDVEKKLQKIAILEQKIFHYEYLVWVVGLEFDLCTHTYTCKCSTQFERDKAVSLLASFDVMDVTSVFQSESKTWLVMGSYKDE